MGICCDTPANSELTDRHDFTPLEHRKCRDVLWLLVWFACLIASIVISYTGATEGDLDRLRFGISSNATLCSGPHEKGFDKLVYCFNGTAIADGNWQYDSLVFSVCAESCPVTKADLVSVYEAKKDEFEAATGMSATFWEASNYEAVSRLCLAPSLSVLNRCLYDFSVSNVTDLGIQFQISLASDPGNTGLVEASQMVTNSYSDIATTWYIILICGVAGGVVVSFAFLQLMRMFASLIVWSTILLFFVCLLAVDYLLATKAGYVNGNDASSPDGSGTSSQQDPQIDNEYEKYYRYLFWIFAVGTVVLTLVLGFMINRIRLAVALVKETARVMRVMPQLLFTPIIPVIGASLVFMYGIFFAAYLASTGTIESGKLQWDTTLRYLLFYHGFFCLWMLFMVVGFHSVVMAGGIAQYYWTRDKNEISSPLTHSAYRAVRYHFGSIALGSLVLAIIRAIKWYLMWMTRQLKKHGGSENRVMKFVLCCLSYCVHCVEKFVQFLTKNAYILVAVDGHSFCYSAGQAWKLIMSNAARMTAVNVVSAYLFFIAKLVVGLVCALLATLWIEYALSYSKNDITVTSAFAPSVCTFILGFCCAHLFYEVADFTIDTLLLCFCLDDVRNAQSGNYYASTSLQKFMATAPKMKREEELQHM